MISRLSPVLQGRKLRLREIEEPGSGMARQPGNGKASTQTHIYRLCNIKEF